MEKQGINAEVRDRQHLASGEIATHSNDHFVSAAGTVTYGDIQFLTAEVPATHDNRQLLAAEGSIDHHSFSVDQPLSVNQSFSVDQPLSVSQPILVDQPLSMTGTVTNRDAQSIALATHGYDRPLAVERHLDDTNASSFRFLSLPKEIRSMIYQPLRLGKIRLNYPQTGEETPQRRLTKWMGLLRVSKFINEETRHELYHWNRFELFSNSAMAICTWVSRIGAANQQELRSLSLNYRGTDSDFFTKFDLNLAKKRTQWTTPTSLGNLRYYYHEQNLKSTSLVNDIERDLKSLQLFPGLRFLRLYMWDSAIRTLALAKNSTENRPKRQQFKPYESFQALREAIRHLQGVEILHVGLLGGDFKALERVAREIGVIELRITLIDKEATSSRICQLRKRGWIPIATVINEKLTNIHEAMEEIDFSDCLPPRRTGIHHFMLSLRDEDEDI